MSYICDWCGGEIQFTNSKVTLSCEHFIYCQKCVHDMKKHGYMICDNCNEQTQENMTILLRDYDGFIISVKLSVDATVYQLKERISEKLDISPDTQRIIYAGRQLCDDNFLMEYNIVNGDSVHLVKALRGD